ncbi:MAG: thioesterase [Candidatus Eremiobacter antarcticus]|nr:PaaI family thioesterase [Candidatus Eremiobacteraeota bacterium]MBC5807394.1 PaaI family thioesterase [Candidatus Eremiobacteraeota bacterium]PZR63196.1 MAG: thioesterase [Candidatus Eremiobacter sp. RRmetagenome_bin22]
MSGPTPVLSDDRRCFACGPENPHGLRLSFDYGDGVANSTFVAGSGFGGWTTIVHGGIIVTLLDEAMAHAAIASGTRAVTARLEVRFRKAAPVGVPLHIEGRLEGRRGRLLTLTATVSAVDGTLYAQGRGRFVADDGSSG